MFSSLGLIGICLAYLGVLFLVAWYGDRRPLYPTRTWMRPHVYALALAVYCTSWTFYGAVGSAATNGLDYLAIYLGPAILFIVFGGLVRRVVTITHDRNITSIADFIASRFGKSQYLAALVTLIALTAAVPYVALQFKAVAMSLEVLSGTHSVAAGPWIADGALYVALLLALFAILFGTRAVDVTEHHHGLMLAIALESVVKLLAFIAVGVFAFALLGDLPEVAAPTLDFDADGALSIAFLNQTLLAFAAALCLPRQFQVGAVECENVSDVRTARWAFPAYLALFSVLVLPVVQAGMALAPASVHPDRYVLWLPLHQGAEWLALLAFIGGFSAATGMIIVECVALATMVSNELVMPALSRSARFRVSERANLSRIILWVRRAAILVLILAAFSYYRLSDAFANLAAVGLLAFVAVAQFAPAVVAGVYFRNASAAGARAGLLVGFALWLYTLFLPSLAGTGLLPPGWVGDGPFGIGWLRPQALFGLDGLDPVTHGTLWSLGANLAAFWLVSSWRRPTVSERFRARAFLDTAAPASTDPRLAGRASVGDLRDLAARIVGDEAARRALDDYARTAGRPLARDATADRGLVQHVERLLAGAIGASSARLVLTSALRGSGMELDDVAALLDETSQELRFSRGLIASTFEHMAQGISVVDADQRLVAWNRRYQELFDYPDDMLYVGRPVADLIRHNAQRGLLGAGEVDDQVARRVWHLRIGRPHVFLRDRPDGRTIESRGTPLPDGGYLMTFTDVTDYKRVEHELREATERLEQRVAERTRALSDAMAAQRVAQLAAETANQSKSRFVAGITHDLLQPLNAARLFASALRARPALDPEVAQLGERIDTALRAGEELIDDLLEISRLDTGAMRADVGSFRLADLFDTLRAQFAGVAAGRGLALRIHGLDLWLRSDPRLLRRVLQNLVSNALRYTHAGGVLLAARRRGGMVRIEVWDTGPGIPAEHQRAIFEEFQRLEHASPWGEKGLGLGLSICERITRLLGHRLGLRSRVGRGSVFSVDVPIGVATTVAAPAASVDAGTLPRLRILCLDNDPDILDGMRALLERWGMTVCTATGVDEALARVDGFGPQAILADYHLHDRIEGLDALDVLRARCDVPGALITADASDALAGDARRRGYPLLRKPVKPAALRALISSLARQRKPVPTP
jgi:Na+/proline symporter/signal transduction histidine kinase